MSISSGLELFAHGYSETVYRQIRRHRPHLGTHGPGPQRGKYQTTVKLVKNQAQRYTPLMKLIDYNLEKDIQTLRKIEKSAAEQGRPTKHLFRTRSAEEVSRPYSKTSTWKKMAEEIENPRLRSEFTQALTK